MTRQYYGGIICGRCESGDEHPIIAQEIEEDGNVIYRHSYAICAHCGEPLGETEIFQLDYVHTIEREKVQKALDKFRKVWYN